MPSKMNMEQLENVQKKATKWTLSSNEDYKDRLRTLNLLPLSQYMELHDFLMFIDIINNKFDHQLLVNGDEQSFTRQRLRGDFPLAKNRLTKTQWLLPKEQGTVQPCFEEAERSKCEKRRFDCHLLELLRTSLLPGEQMHMKIPMPMRELQHCYKTNSETGLTNGWKPLNCAQIFILFLLLLLLLKFSV